MDEILSNEKSTFTLMSEFNSALINYPSAHNIMSLRNNDIKGWPCWIDSFAMVDNRFREVQLLGPHIRHTDYPLKPDGDAEQNEHQGKEKEAAEEDGENSEKE